jgi:hypothetical protein
VIRIPRWPMAITAFALGLMHAGLGIYWSQYYEHPLIGLLAVWLFLVALAPTVLSFKDMQIPAWQGLVNLLIATVLPRVIEDQVPRELLGTYATWYIGGLAVLLGATALRGQLYFAWGGLIIATVEIILWEGVQNLLKSGWIGLILMVVIGHAGNLGVRQSEEDIDRANAEAAESIVVARRAEAVRDTRTRTFANSAQDIQNLLSRAIAQKGKLTEDDRREAILLENDLSDDVMGGELVTLAIRRAARLARSRGVEVYLMDQGVLGSLARAELDELHHKVEDVISQQISGKITVRATAGNRWLVSITAYERGSKVPNIDWKF